MPEFSVTPDNIDVEFSVYCECGNGLCDQSTGSSDSRGHSITVELCENCAEGERRKSYNLGFEKGKEEGKEEAWRKGYEEGTEDEKIRWRRMF